MRAIVIGGSGFIGSHLCRRLLRDDWHVVCMSHSIERTERVRDLRDHPLFVLTQGDVTTRYILHADVIFNASGQGSPRHYREDPIGTLRTNVLGALSIMESVERSGARLVQLSSIRANETDHLGVNGGYIEGKRCAETVIASYNATRGTHGTIVRLGNTYGPGMATDDSKVLPHFVMRAVRGEELKILGGGQQVDSFCHVSDVVDALTKLATTDVQSPINLGSPTPISILELARLIVDVTGSGSTVTFDETDTTPRRNGLPDYSPIMDSIDWRPEVGLREGIAATAAHYRVALGV